MHSLVYLTACCSVANTILQVTCAQVALPSTHLLRACSSSLRAELNQIACTQYTDFPSL